MKKILLFLFFIGAILLVSFLYAEDRHSKITSSVLSEEAQIKRIINLIEESPAWADVEAVELEKREKIVKNCELIAEYNLQVIRASVSKFISDNQRSKSFDVSNMSRLLVLNRVLFKAPSKAVMGKGSFGGWRGRPSNNGEINWLWPLSINEAGLFKLTGIFQGYKGHEFHALEEFDYFNSTFGLRKSSATPK